MYKSFVWTLRFLTLLSVALVGAVPPKLLNALNAGVPSGAALLFIENVGQFDARARFQVRGGVGIMWLAEDALWITIASPPGKTSTRPGARLRAEPRRVVNLKLHFANANPHPRLEPFARQDNVIHYYLGRDPAQWRTNVPVWGGVRYRDIYPGVDLEIDATGGRWSWRLLVHDVQFDLAGVRLLVEGSENIAAQDGALALSTEVGGLTLPLLDVQGVAPAGRSAVTRAANGVLEIAAPFAAASGDVLSPQTAYPEKAYLGSYLGGSGNDWVYDVALSGQGDILDRSADRAVWIAGWTASSNFPTNPGSALSGASDAFVTKMQRGAVYVAPAFSAYIGGTDQDGAQAIAVDANGNAYVAGWTKSSDFATAGTPFDSTYNGCTDAFVLKMDGDGHLLYASYLGGSYVNIPGLGNQCGDDQATAIAVDAQGIVYLTGFTYSQDFPTTAGAYDTVLSNFDIGLNKDTFVVKLDPGQGASGLLYSTFIGGGTPSWGEDIAIDESGNVYVAVNAQGGPGGGRNYFPTTSGAYSEAYTGTVGVFFKLNPGGNGAADLLYSTFLGLNEAGGSAYGIAVDAAGHAYVCGQTSAPGFAVTAGALDATCGTDGNCNSRSDYFVRKLAPAGHGSADLLYSTFLGGDLWEGFRGGCDIALGTNGDVYVTGDTSSTTGLPITADAYDTSGDALWGDVFVVRLRLLGNGAADSIYGTFVGGSGAEGGNTAIAVDDQDRVYVVGETQSTDFPTTAHATYKTHSGSQDVFLFRLLTPPRADLSTSIKTVDPNEAAAGQVVTFTVQLINSGVFSATALFTDTLPAALLLQGSPTASAGGAPTVNGQTITWAGSVTEDTTITITYATLLTSTTSSMPTAVNVARIDDGSGNVYTRRAYVNGHRVLLPLVLKSK